LRLLGIDRLFSSKFLNLNLAQVKTSTGQILEQIFVEPLSNTIAAVIVKEGKILLVKQRRVFGDSQSWEIPSGHIYEGEMARNAVRRKVEEITGHQVINITQVGWSIPDSTFMKNEKYYFLIEVGEKIKDFDIDSISKIEIFSLEKVHKLIIKGKIVDEVTLTGLMLAEKKGYL
jgi:ADP-ribose pyrophosphatase